MPEKEAKIGEKILKKGADFPIARSGLKERIVIEELSEEEIIEILKHGEIKILGQIEHEIPDVKNIRHQNEVNLVLVEVAKDGKKILAVFKPLSGEGQGKLITAIYEGGVAVEFKEELRNTKKQFWENIAYYPREVFAYLVSKELGLNIVPPTVVREIEINGKKEIGALQLFIPRERYKMASTAILNKEITIEEILDSPDILKIAILDFLLSSWARSDDDYLVCKEDGVVKLLAIDHGNSMSEAANKEYVTSDPSAEYTYYQIGDKQITSIVFSGIRRMFLRNKDLQRKDYSEILEPILENAQKLLNNREKFKKILEEENLLGENLITEEDLEAFFLRLELLIKERRVL